MRAFPLLTCLVVLLSSSCNKPAAPAARTSAASVAGVANGKNPAEFIIQPGTYKLFDGKLQVKIAAGTDGASYMFAVPTEGGSVGEGFEIEKGAN